MKIHQNTITLSDMADGFLMLIPFSVSAVADRVAQLGYATVRPGWVLFTYDKNKPNEQISVPTQNADTTLRLEGDQGSSFEIQQVSVDRLSLPGTGIRRSIVAVGKLGSKGNLLAHVLDLQAWALNPDSLEEEIGKETNDGWTNQMACWNKVNVVHVDQLVPWVSGDTTTGLGLQMRLSVNSLLKDFWRKVMLGTFGAQVPPTKGIELNASDPDRTIGKLNVSIGRDPVPWEVNPQGSKGFFMICQGVFAPNPTGHFDWQQWIRWSNGTLTDDQVKTEISAWALKRSHVDPGQGAPPNAEPQEILYVEGLTGAPRIPTF
jgi:hypothetical protein